MTAFQQEDSDSGLGVKNIEHFIKLRSAISKIALKMNNGLVSFPAKVKVTYLHDRNMRFIKEHNEKQQIRSHETFIDLFYPPRRTLIFFRSFPNFK